MAEDQTPTEFLEDVIATWELVCSENEAHRDLVSEGEWSGWESFRSLHSGMLTRIVSNFDGSISDEDCILLEGFMNSVHGAKRMNREELEYRKESEAELEEARIADERAAAILAARDAEIRAQREAEEAAHVAEEAAKTRATLGARLKRWIS